MAYTWPTPTSFKARFPSFAAVDDDIVQTALDEAHAYVDEKWPESQYALGAMLYAAHVLTLDGHGTGTEAEMGKAGLLAFDRLKSGQLEVSKGVVSGGSGNNAAVNVLQSTSYGKRYLALVNQLFAAVLVV